MDTQEVVLDAKAEAKRQCILRIADTLKEWAGLDPDARDKFMIASITHAFGWSPDMYVDLGFSQEAEG